MPHRSYAQSLSDVVPPLDDKSSEAVFINLLSHNHHPDVVFQERVIRQGPCPSLIRR